jgi:hypothetical protein
MFIELEAAYSILRNGSTYFTQVNNRQLNDGERTIAASHAVEVKRLMYKERGGTAEGMTPPSRPSLQIQGRRSALISNTRKRARKRLTLDFKPGHFHGPSSVVIQKASSSLE